MTNKLMAKLILSLLNDLFKSNGYATEWSHTHGGGDDNQPVMIDNEHNVLLITVKTITVSIGIEPRFGLTVRNEDDGEWIAVDLENMGIDDGFAEIVDIATHFANGD